MWRLGLDLGTNSIGWSVIELDDDGQPCSVTDMGVRIFPDGREPATGGRIGDSLAVTRRDARSLRKNRDRRINRKNAAMSLLVECGLMPEEKDTRKKLEFLNPYECRAKAATEKVSRKELGRALFHLSLRRGFKSNRKTDSDEETEFKQKISALRDALDEKKQTLGQYLWGRGEDGLSLRFRGEDGDYYPDRQMYEEEFEQIRKMQGNALTDNQWDNLYDVLFFQRPLKPQEKGKCQFYPDQERVHEALPIAHKFRIVQEVNNLRWLDDQLQTHELDAEQQAVLFTELHKKKTLSWGGMRKLKKADGQKLFREHCTFNFEDIEGRRKGFKGSETHIDMKKLLGAGWTDLSEADQNDLIEKLYDTESEHDVEDLGQVYGLTAEQITVLGKYKLSSKTGKVSRKFMEDVTESYWMQERGLRYDEAVAELGLHHSDFEDGVVYDELPYYGKVLTGSTMNAHPGVIEKGVEYQYGKIGNPTVHVALNQLRRVANDLIGMYGAPEEIHLEVGRELKQSRSDRSETNKKISDNEKANDIRRKLCQEHGIANPSYTDLKKVKLWEELGKEKFARQCVFSGKVISDAMLFNGEVEIEHILPFSKTLDNSNANLTLATRQANRIKRDRSPYDALNDFAAQGWDWDGILARVERLRKSKRTRFSPDALECWTENNNFLDRQVTDNSYISKISRRYLGKMCDPAKVVCVSGQMTGILRAQWGLGKLLWSDGEKSRDDHRHHAIDSLTVGLTSRSVIKQINTDRAKDGRIKFFVPPLHDGMREQAKVLLADMVISVKPDHGENGKFFNETAYGFVGEDTLDPEMRDYNLVVRKPIDSLSKKEISTIRDPLIREKAQDFLAAELGADWSKENDKKISEILHKFGHGQTPPVKKVRILVANQSVKPIPDSPYKGYAIPNYICCDIYRLPKGKAGKWKKGEYEYKGVFWSYIDMKTKERDEMKPHPAAKFMMRLYKNDMIEVEIDGRKQIMRVYGYSTTRNKLDLRPQLAANSPQKFISINVLKDKIRKLKVSESGKML